MRGRAVIQPDRFLPRARKRAEVAKRLALTVDGRKVALVAAGTPVLTHPKGAGGLHTTRLELPLRAAGFRETPQGLRFDARA